VLNTPLRAKVLPRHFVGEVNPLPLPLRPPSAFTVIDLALTEILRSRPQELLIRFAELLFFSHNFSVFLRIRAARKLTPPLLPQYDTFSAYQVHRRTSSAHSLCNILPEHVGIFVFHLNSVISVAAEMLRSRYATVLFFAIIGSNIMRLFW
jgi:hypothetical protein